MDNFCAKNHLNKLIRKVLRTGLPACLAGLKHKNLPVLGIGNKRIKIPPVQLSLINAMFMIKESCDIS